MGLALARRRARRSVGRMSWFTRRLILTGMAMGLAAALRAGITAEPAVVDLGRRAQNTTAEASVTLVNTGADAVTIYDVSADCSCTAGTPEKQTLEPGEKTSLAIRSETRSYQGEITRRVALRTSDGDVVIPVKATISPYERWDVTPPFLTLAPSKRGDEAGGEVVLAHLGTEAVEVTGITAEPPWVAGAVARRGEREFVVALTKKATAPAGHHLVKMTAATTDPVNPSVAFNVFMSVNSPVQVKPAPLVMPVGKVGAETRLKAELLGWDENLPPRLELAHGSATITGTGREGLAFEIAITPRKSGAMTQLLKIYRGDELELEVAVILRTE